MAGGRVPFRENRGQEGTRVGLGVCVLREGGGRELAGNRRHVLGRTSRAQGWGPDQCLHWAEPGLEDQGGGSGTERALTTGY